MSRSVSQVKTKIISIEFISISRRLVIVHQFIVALKGGAEGDVHVTLCFETRDDSWMSSAVILSRAATHDEPTANIFSQQINVHTAKDGCDFVKVFFH